MDLNAQAFTPFRMTGSSIRNRVLVLAVVIILILTVLGGVIIWHDIRSNYLDIQSLRMMNLIQSKDAILRQDLSDTEQDIRFLAQTPTLNNVVRLLMSPTGATSSGMTVDQARQQLASLFVAFSNAHPDYFQLRLIGLADHGLEVVRVDRDDDKVITLDEEGLSRKGDPDYVRIGAKLTPGEVYLSPITLNYERGKVQAPHLRTLRMVMPVFSAEGARFGMLVINVDVGAFLDSLSRNAADRAYVFLANPDGDFLVHPEASKTFGFDLGSRHRMSDSLAALKPVSDARPAATRSDPALSPVHDWNDTAQLEKITTPMGKLYALSDHVHFDSGNPGRYLTLVVALSSAQVDQAVFKRLQPVLGGLIIITALIMGMILFLLNKALLPLHAFSQMARRIGEGDYNFKLPGVHSGEMSAFLSAFNEMRSGIQRRESDNKKLAERLQGSEAFATAVIDAMPDAVFVIDEKGRIVRTNGKATALFGYSAQEFLALSVEQLLPSRFRGGHVAKRASYGNNPSRREMGRGMELFALRKDGSEFPVDVGLGPMQQQGKNYVTVVLADVSERKADEAALKASEERFRLMTANIRDYSIFMLDPTGLVLNWNPGSERLHGYAANEIVGQSFGRLNVPEDIEAGVPERLLTQARQNGAAEDELWLVRKDGTRFCSQVVVSAVQDEAGELKGFVRIDRDLTERKQTEYLLISRDAADAANEAKSEFLANMSHEIRTPLNGILGLARLLLDTQLSSSQRDYLHKLQDSSNALLRILNDILDFAKIESGRVELEAVSFDLDELLDTSISLFSYNAEQKGIELLLAVAPSVPLHLRGDSLRLSQVLNNLIGNAVKFTERGAVHISVSAQPLTQAGGEPEIELHFSVHDTGIGMTSAQLKKLFQAFQQADATITRRYGGSGLGLVIAQRLVTLMGGEIDVTSTVGEGTTFWFTIRVAPEADREVHPSREPGQLRAMKALVVDDNSTSVNILSDMLGNWGVDVSGAFDAESGLAMARLAAQKGKPFELFLIDWKMPGLDGIAMAERIHEMVRRKEIAQAPMLVMATAFGQEYVHQSAKHIHMDALLEKPVTPSRLFDLIISIQNQQEPGLADIPETMALSLHEQTKPIHGARVLLVEDNATNQFVAKAFLDKMGLVVDLAENGQQAIDQVTEHDYDAVLMDLQMPVMDGLEASRQIRRMPKGKGLPIIAMTAAAQNSDRAITEAAGMNAHITKPIDLSVLTLTLLAWIHPKTADAQSPLPVADVATPAQDVTNPSFVQAAEGQGAPSEGAFEVPGLDLRAAIADLGGDWGLLRQVLNGFLRDFGQVASKMDTLVELAQWDEARRIAHTIKGLSRTIGAHLLFEAARDFELRLKEPEGKPGALSIAHAVFTKQVVSVLDKITRSSAAGSLFDGRPGVMEDNITDADRLRILRELSSLLRQSIIVPHSFKDDLLLLLQHRIDKAQIQSLFQAIGELDYEQSERIVEQMIQILEG